LYSFCMDFPTFQPSNFDEYLQHWWNICGDGTNIECID
jgi:hypothetical protein